MLHKSRLAQLSELIDRLEWHSIEPVYRRGAWNGINSEDLVVIFEHSSKKLRPDKIDQVRLRIGKKICDKLEWKIGDKILPLFNPDDQLFFMLVKSDHQKGYTLGTDSSVDINKMAFKWPDTLFPLTKARNEKVEYEIYRKQLLFKVSGVECKNR